MAGIAGIICKDKGLMNDQLHEAFQSMMGKLYYTESQLHKIGSFERALFGNAVSVNTRENYHFQENIDLGIYLLVDGLIYINSDERNIICREFNLSQELNDYKLLPWLYRYYGQEIVHHITGWYNIFIYDLKENYILLFNDRLGYLPLYYFEDEKYFLFASKIECILASGLMKEIEFDPVTIAEHLFFNYPLSDNTYIKGISTLTNATLWVNNESKTTERKYWSMGSLFGKEALNDKDSFEFLNTGLKNAILKGASDQKNQINLSLTGGWDSRVVLSYLLPEYRQNLNTYSFGAEKSDDIIIPRFIASKEKLKYTPYLLDVSYLNQSFPQQAIDTIILSNGTRGYKRAHYLYAIREVSKISDFVLTGIFGDEVFKVSQAAGGEVLSKNAINFLESNFNVDKTIDIISQHSLFDFLDTEKSEILTELKKRLQAIKTHMNPFETISEKYYVLRFEYNLRKYFGHEANSYNDFINSFSPFIDHDFLKAFSETRYYGTRFHFNSNSLILKRQATQLYYEITKANYPKLTEYNSARGYSMKDAATLIGQLKIMYKKYLRNKSKSVDGFNTKPTDTIFSEFILSQSQQSNPIFKKPAPINLPLTDKLNSLYYWVDQIAKGYC